MGMFQALDTATSGATLSRQWLDVISDNVANVNTVHGPGQEPFRARQLIAREADAELVPGSRSTPGTGVRVAAIARDQSQAQQVFDPDHPLADENGNVTRAVVDMGKELTNLLLAQRTYTANLTVIERARNAYEAALRISHR